MLQERSHQLIRLQPARRPGETIRIEDSLKITIPLRKFDASRLKVCFGQLRFDHQVSDAQVYLCTIHPPANHGKPRLIPEYEVGVSIK
jgi:hypothetical protein